MFKLLFLLVIFATPVFGYSAQGRECLALNIYHESRGESYEGQLAVAHVTLNRVHSASFPNTICAVVWQARQFSWTHDGRSDSPRDLEAWRIAQEMARIAISWYEVGEDFSHGATFYHADYVSPFWADEFSRTVHIGAHIFYAN